MAKPGVVLKRPAGPTGALGNTPNYPRLRHDGNPPDKPAVIVEEETPANQDKAADRKASKSSNASREASDAQAAQGGGGREKQHAKRDKVIDKSASGAGQDRSGARRTVGSLVRNGRHSKSGSRPRSTLGERTEAAEGACALRGEAGKTGLTIAFLRRKNFTSAP